MREFIIIFIGLNVVYNIGFFLGRYFERKENKRGQQNRA